MVEALEIFQNNFFFGRLCKLFDKTLVCAWACAALAMCLQNVWVYHTIAVVMG